jgi:ribonuclease P protein component
VYRDGKKYGVVAGKKVSLKAVERNKVKRRLRHLCMSRHNLLPQNAWIVFIAAPGAVAVSYKELEEDFEKLVGYIAAKKNGNGVYKAV